MEKHSHPEIVRVVEIPACQMVVSECGMYGDCKLEAFNEWFGALPRTHSINDFLAFDSERGGFVWYYVYQNGMQVPNGFGIIDFPGGLYAVVTGVDGCDNTEAMAAVNAFLAASEVFAKDPTRQELGNIITSPVAAKAIGYEQMDYYTPIKIIEK